MTQAVVTLQEASPREEETLQEEEVVGAIAETKTSREAGSTSVETGETQRVRPKMSLEPRPKMRQMMGSKMSLEPRPKMRQMMGPMMKLRMKPEMRRNTRLETRRKPTREFPQELSLHRSGNLTYHRPRDPTCYQPRNPTYYQTLNSTYY
jgi:hypothetical protein